MKIVEIDIEFFTRARSLAGRWQQKSFHGTSAFSTWFEIVDLVYDSSQAANFLQSHHERDHSVPWLNKEKFHKYHNVNGKYMKI